MGNVCECCCACCSRTCSYGWISGQPYWARETPCFTAPITVSLGLITLAAVTYLLVTGFKEDAWEMIGLGIGLLPVSLVLLSCAFPQVRLRMRSGVWAQAPGSREDIIEKMKATSPPTTIGEGWSFTVGLRTADSPAISLRGNWSGVVSWPSDSTVRVKSGTLFGELDRELWAKGCSLEDRPQFDQLSIGGAVRTAAHGWSTGRWFIDTIVALEGVERGSGKVVEARREHAEFWSIAFDDRWVILEVELPHIPTQTVRVEQKVGVPDDPADVNDLESPTERQLVSPPYRLMFASGKQFIWRQASLVEGKETRTDLFYTSPLGTLMSFVAQSLDCAGNRSFVASLTDAQVIVQTLGPFLTFFQMVLNAPNMELMVPMRFDWQRVAPILAGFHKVHGGRTELRERTVGGRTVTALDMVLFENIFERGRDKTPTNTAAYLAFLHDNLGVTTGAPHPGKYVPPQMGPIKLLPYASLWESFDAEPAKTKAQSMMCG